MQYNTFVFDKLNIKITYSLLKTENNDAEFHAILQVIHPEKMAGEEQFSQLQLATKKINSITEYNIVPVWQRWFLSDAFNQQKFLPTDANCSLSVIQQAPLDGSKAAVWIYGIENGMIETQGNRTVISRKNYQHYFHSQLNSKANGSFQQTENIFTDYINSLAELEPTLTDDCIRTWLFVQNVDLNYDGMVKARKEIFGNYRLNADNHYIASTGIEGKFTSPETVVLMDAYAVEGLLPQQIRYLKGSSHLNPTYEYGVTFERGTQIKYADREHVFISGTASIDNKGNILYPQHIEQQTIRTLENISTLLEEAQTSMEDISQMIVYLRDSADFNTVQTILEQRHPHTPKVIVLAPVCRPGWLIEIECSAIKATSNQDFKAF